MTNIFVTYFTNMILLIASNVKHKLYLNAGRVLRVLLASFLAASNPLSSQLDKTVAIHTQNAACMTRITRVTTTMKSRPYGTDRLLVNTRAVIHSRKATA